MDYLALSYENLRLRKLVFQLEQELQEERDRAFQSVELLMQGEALRQRIMLDAILGKFPPTPIKGIPCKSNRKHRRIMTRGWK
jgi:hypothetical protein